MRPVLPVPVFTVVFLACGSPSPQGSATPVAEPADAAVLTAADAGAAPQAKGNVKTLFVREELADCSGESPRKCMQVRESPSEEWTFFYAPIEGFKYEEHHKYELRVEVTENPNPPADGSSRRYRLVEVVSKTKVSPK